MKKALIVISACLLIAVVALCLVWSSLNGQKTELADKLDVQTRAFEASSAEAKGFENDRY